MHRLVVGGVDMAICRKSTGVSIRAVSLEEGDEKEDGNNYHIDGDKKTVKVGWLLTLRSSIFVTQSNLYYATHSK